MVVRSLRPNFSAKNIAVRAKHKSKIPTSINGELGPILSKSQPPASENTRIPNYPLLE